MEGKKRLIGRLKKSLSLPNLTNGLKAQLLLTGRRDQISGWQESWYQFVQDFMTATAKRFQVLLNKGIDLQTHPLPAEPKSRGLCRKEILTNNNLERKKEQFNGQNLLCQGMTLLSPTERSAIVPSGAGPLLMVPG